MQKFQEGKFLGTELLNSAQDVLRSRQVVQALMKKCAKLASQMERAVAAGATSIMKQPSILSPRFRSHGYNRHWVYLNTLTANYEIIRRLHYFQGRQLRVIFSAVYLPLLCGYD